ncbi:MAG TPA: transporter substrate-binding domain-containing protein [Candidatus Enterocloster faecavium]|uniref:Transporter substrate-binding domain-containing protein n=1 Tax=Candidatus Enterocloster faecavium TaxID=2838560 RepID=A0A9D2RM61_9FIRM|nr:transporter substrate-binding domain-containing protein [Candidatus Enterocloster faecavium]
MKKVFPFIAGAMLAMGLLMGCSSSSTQETTAAAAAETEAEETTAAQSEEGSEEASQAESEGEEVSADNPFAGKTVKVGCSATFVPFESIEMAADGTKTYVGMNIDIVRTIVEKNGGQVEFVDMPFKSLMAAIQAGQIDFCSGGMAPTDERRETLDFSDIFFYPRNAIVYRAEDNYPDLDSLKGKTVAYVFGTNYQQVAESIEGAKTVGIQGSPACIEEVKSGRADACIIDGAGATEFLKNNDGLAMSLLDKTEDCFAIGFPKNSPYYETFNNTLKEMMEDGELDEIIASHLNEQFILD